MHFNLQLPTTEAEDAEHSIILLIQDAADALSTDYKPLDFWVGHFL